MSMQRLLGLTIRIIQQFRRDPRSLAIMYIAPVLIIGLIWWIYDTDPQSQQIGIVQEQSTTSAAEFVSILNASDRIEATVIPADTAAKLIQNGSYDAIVDIPADFIPADRTSSPLKITVDGSNPASASAVLTAINQATTQVLYQALDIDGNPIDLEVDYLYGEYNRFDLIAPVLIAFFAFFFTFLLASVSFLRERTTGTFEQLAVSPIKRAEIMSGYSIGFGIFAILQAILIILYVVFVLNTDQSGSVVLAIFFTILLTLGTVSLGIFLSAFARTELQVIQFIPIVLVPQVFLSGLLFQVEDLPPLLQFASKFMPLTYANEALRGVMLRGEGLTELWTQTLFLIGFGILMIVAGSLSLRRND